MDKNIFTLISRPGERLKLWQDLAQAHGEILCKGKEENICHLRVKNFNIKEQYLECIFDSSVRMNEGEEYLGHFFLGGEKYYFQAQTKIEQNKVLIPIPTELYHLQRRQNYRVHVPESYQAFYNILTVNGKPEPINGRLMDLSSQGCRVVYRLDRPLMKVADHVTGNLVIGKRDPIQIQGVIRHIKADESNSAQQNFGIEFTPLPVIIENKLFAITLEIHKEFFRRA
ncbi:MAG: PilZ domain-containing protein [Bdellovibrio sp.]